jgi:hypothetical protein
MIILPKHKKTKVVGSLTTLFTSLKGLSIISVTLKVRSEPKYNSNILLNDFSQKNAPQLRHRKSLK